MWIEVENVWLTDAQRWADRSLLSNFVWAIRCALPNPVTTTGCMHIRVHTFWKSSKTKCQRKSSKKVVKKFVKKSSFKGTPNYKVGQKAPVRSQLAFCQSHIFYLNSHGFFPLNFQEFLAVFLTNWNIGAQLRMTNFGGFSILNFF